MVRQFTQLGQTIYIVHDMYGNRIAECLYDASAGTSSLIREYLWANGMNVAVVENGALYYVRTDHIGRPVFATDDTGTKVWEATYLSFGGVHTSTGPNSDLRFPGQWFQSETGLHQNWMRDYDPTTGRYMQADPLGLVDGASVYGYVSQNPGRYVDRFGLFKFSNDGLIRQDYRPPMIDSGHGGGSLSTAGIMAMLGMMGGDTPISEPAIEEEQCSPCEHLPLYHRQVPHNPLEILQALQTNRVRGYTPRTGWGGGDPIVKAFNGPLPPGVIGYTFCTLFPPTGFRNWPGGRPGPFWREGTLGVTEGRVPQYSGHPHAGEYYVEIPVYLVK